MRYPQLKCSWKNRFQIEFKWEKPSGQLGGPEEGNLGNEASFSSERACLATEGAGKVSFAGFNGPRVRASTQA